MILLKLREYLQTHSNASLKDLACHFDMPESTIQGMLEEWTRKNRVTIENIDNDSPCKKKCGACSESCSSTSGKIIYRWR